MSKSTVREVLAFKRCFSVGASLQDFVAKLVNVSHEGLVSRDGFVQVLTNLGIDVRTSLHGSGYFLLDFFDAFDRPSCGFVDTVELITGATVFFDGSKSAKLMFAFELFDLANRNALRRSAMWKFFRSFLTPILLLCKLVPGEKLDILIDEAAEWCVEDIVSMSPNADNTDITFDDLSAYYSERGFLVASWLELLDLGKMAKLGNN